jgi:hypothetical protein
VNLTHKRSAALVLDQIFNDYRGEIAVLRDPARRVGQLTSPHDCDVPRDIAKGGGGELGGAAFGCYIENLHAAMRSGEK